MEVQAISKFVRISPLKARDLAREIQGKPVAQAVQITRFSARKAAGLIGKTLRSAIANAENNAGLSADSLVVKTAVVDDGPVMRRFRAGARGMYKPVQKRMSHIKIILSEKEKASGK